MLVCGTATCRPHRRLKLFLAGCGKTSLVKYLAHVLGASFRCLNFHAGTTLEGIRVFVREAERAAEDGRADVWLFLDEVRL